MGIHEDIWRLIAASPSPSGFNPCFKRGVGGLGLISLNRISAIVIGMNTYIALDLE